MTGANQGLSFPTNVTQHLANCSGIVFLSLHTAAASVVYTVVTSVVHVKNSRKRTLRPSLPEDQAEGDTCHPSFLDETLPD